MEMLAKCYGNVMEKLWREQGRSRASGESKERKPDNPENPADPEEEVWAAVLWAGGCREAHGEALFFWGSMLAHCFPAGASAILRGNE